MFTRDTPAPLARYLLPAVLLILTVACSRPGSYEEFVRAEDAVGGVYEFALPFQGTTSNTTSVVTTYDISLYTAPLAEPLQLEILWQLMAAKQLNISNIPESSLRPGVGDGLCETADNQTVACHSETVWFPAGVNSDLYRSGIKVPTEATITIRVKPLNPPQTFRGLGIICKQNDGTR